MALNSLRFQPFTIHSAAHRTLLCPALALPKKPLRGLREGGDLLLAHSACYAMQLSGLIAQAGGTPEALDVQADVSLGPDPAGFRLTGIKLTVRGEAEGLTDEQFAQVAQEAKASCPVSKALTGVDITLDAQLEH
jgi:organic hydroperoxide reductase OsmC/OhrA